MTWWFSFCPSLLYSIDFNDFKMLQEKNDWSKIEQMFTDIALKLQNAGAECIIMATNTPHPVGKPVLFNFSKNQAAEEGRITVLLRPLDVC
jgi:hypothetical protein